MNEQILIQKANAGDVSAMLELANYYSEKAKGGDLDDKVGDVISIEDFLKSMNSE